MKINTNSVHRLEKRIFISCRHNYYFQTFPNTFTLTPKVSRREEEKQVRSVSPVRLFRQLIYNRETCLLTKFSKLLYTSNSQKSAFCDQSLNEYHLKCETVGFI